MALSVDCVHILKLVQHLAVSWGIQKLRKKKAQKQTPAIEEKSGGSHKQRKTAMAVRKEGRRRRVKAGYGFCPAEDSDRRKCTLERKMYLCSSCEAESSRGTELHQQRAPWTAWPLNAWVQGQGQAGNDVTPDW